MRTLLILIIELLALPIAVLFLIWDRAIVLEEEFIDIIEGDDQNG